MCKLFFIKFGEFSVVSSNIFLLCFLSAPLLRCPLCTCQCELRYEVHYSSTHIISVDLASHSLFSSSASRILPPAENHFDCCTFQWHIFYFISFYNFCIMIVNLFCETVFHFIHLSYTMTHFLFLIVIIFIFCVFN